NRTPNPRFWRPVGFAWRSAPRLRRGSLRRLAQARFTRSRHRARSVPLALWLRPLSVNTGRPARNRRGTASKIWQDRRESDPQPPVLETGGLCLALGAAASPRFPPAPRSGSLHSLAPSRSLRSARALAATAVRQHWPPRAKPPRDGVENLAGQEGIEPPTPGF